MALETPPQTPLVPALDEVSQRLVEARLAATPLEQFPGELPTTLQDAYAVQSASIARWSDEVAGWKVGGVPPALRPVLGAARLSGPIFRTTVAPVEVGAEQSMSIFDGGFAAVEAEFIFRIDEPIEADGTSYSDDDLVERVTLHVGAEIASSPMASINRIGPVCVVCDFGNNAGLVVGPPVPNWRHTSSERLTAQMSVDGAVVGRGSAAGVEGGLLQPLRFLIGLCAHRGLSLREGMFVSCGALTGIHEVKVNSQATVDFGAYGAFRVAFEARRPMPYGAGAAKD